MIRLKTDIPEYWTERFEVNDDDLAHLRDYVHDRGAPCPTADLVRVLIERRIAEERAAISRELAKGTPYEPKGTFQVGQRLVFPAYEFAVGEIVGERVGSNPTYGNFKVLQVHFEDDGDTREFASELTHPHKLNLDTALAASEASVDSVFQDRGEELANTLVEKLAGNKLGFVQLDGQWFLRALLAPINAGHVNIAEALIELNDRAIRTDEILKELDLPREVPPAVSAFSLELSLRGDERFDLVESGGRPAWYLARLEPSEIRQTPLRMRYTPIPFSREATQPLLITIEQELDDELTDLGEVPVTRKPGDEYALVLTVPHRRVGSIPLTSRTRGFFPATSDGGRTMFSFVDKRTGKTMRGWVVSGGGYALGLRDWYKENGLQAGAWVKLQRTDNPLRVLVDFSPHRMHRDWVRVADGRDGQLVFQLKKEAVAYDYDALMIVAEEDPSRVDALFEANLAAGSLLEEDMVQVFLELAKLSPQGNAHAKTLYAALNLMRRCPPGPVFAALSTHPYLEHVGEGFFAYRREIA